MLRNLRFLAEYFLTRLLVCVIQAMSLSACQRLAHGLAWLVHDVFKMRRRMTLENLKHAYPELSPREHDDLARRMWEHLALMVCEIAHLPRKVRRSTWRRYVRTTGGRLLATALLDERPLVLGSGHFGNFEMAGYLFAMLGFPTVTVARRLDNPYLHRWIGRFRGLNGQRIIDKRGAYPHVNEVLQAGGTMAFLADQHAGRKGCWVTFFGRPVSAHKAIALFALSNDAPLLVGSARRIGGPLEYEFTVHGVADPRSEAREVSGMRPLTQWYTDRIEEMVRLAPEQYWWMHDRWRPRGGVRRKQRKVA